MEIAEVVISTAGIIGTLGGTLVGIRAGYKLWEAEQRTRFHPDRYAKYTQFLEAMNRLMWVEKGSTEEESLIEVSTQASAHIQMIASKPVREAAQELLMRIVEARMEYPQQPTTQDERRHFISASPIDPARENFIRAARKELGITVGE